MSLIFTDHNENKIHIGKCSKVLHYSNIKEPLALVAKSEKVSSVLICKTLACLYSSYLIIVVGIK